MDGLACGDTCPTCKQVVAVAVAAPTGPPKHPLTVAEDKVMAALEGWTELERLIALKVLRYVLLQRQETEYAALSRAIAKAAKK
jgi:hypothetical protein